MNPNVAARVFAALVTGTIVFQLALAAGLPWGEFAWGGTFPGLLPPRMRVASVFSAVLLFAFIVVVWVRAGLIHSRFQSAARKLVWIVVAYCALGVIANTVTPSFKERIIWLPVTALLLWSSVAVARAPSKKPVTPS